MADIKKVIENLSNLLSLKGASEDEIIESERRLKLVFSEEYKTYLSQFGAVMADRVELTGIAKSEYRNVVSVTLQERELNINIPNDMYVIENTGIDGIVIWQNASGKIYQTSPNTQPREIAKTLSDYLLERMNTTS